MFRLIFYDSKRLRKDQKALQKDQKAQGHIQELLGKFALNPFAKGWPIKKLKSSEEATFRLRWNHWRILFDVDAQNKTIIIYRIKQRKEGYK